MIRKATEQDAPAIKALLKRHIETSMFLLGNLESLGINATGHPHATTFYLRDEGEISGVFGCTEAGFLMCQCPELGAEDARAFVRHITGAKLRGITGHPAQTEALMAALSFPAQVWHRNDIEPLYALELSRLQPAPENIRTPTSRDEALLAEWFTTYVTETGLSTPQAAKDEGPNRAKSVIGSDRTELLLDDGAPVAMGSLNAKAGSAVQIGGVFVPKELRGRGLAGRIVAAQLAKARDTGATRAILFAASDNAARAYEKIGFERIGGYRVAMLRAPMIVGEP